MPQNAADVIDWYMDHTKDRIGVRLDATNCVWGCSDLHTDNARNMEWLKGLTPKTCDTLIVAGAQACMVMYVDSSV